MKNTPYAARYTRYGLLALILLYLTLALAFTQAIPFSRAFDEGYHLEYITFIKQHGRLPITYEERAQITRADFPPLYQLLVSLLTVNIDSAGPPDFKFFWDSFRYRAADPHSEQVWTLPTEDTQFPYFGRFSVWQIGRWLSVVLSLATVLVVYLTLRETPLNDIPLAALAGAALLAFIPRYIILGSTLNDDNLLGLLAALYFWLLVKAVKQPARWRFWIGLGLCLGLSMTVKYTLVVAPLEIALVAAWLAKTRHLGWRWFLKRLGGVGGLALLSSSGWFGWNIWFLNTVPQDGWLVGLVRPLLQGGHDTTMNRLSGLASGGQAGLAALPENTNVGDFPEWLQATFFSFWGVDTPSYAYLGIVAVLALTAFGLWRLWRQKPAIRVWLLLFGGHVSLFIILPLLRFGLTRRLSVAAQGRHILIPAAAAVVGLLVWGILAAAPARWQRWVFGAIMAGFILWTGAHLYQYVFNTVIPLPVRAMPQAAAWLPNRVNAQFGDGVELVSCQLDPVPAQGVLRVNLAWRSLAYVNESYLLKVELVNTAGQVVSHWLGYNGGGRLPTLAWIPGDTVFDRLVMPLPDLSAGTYGLQVQLLDGNGGPVPLKKGGAGTVLSLAEVALNNPAHLSMRRNVRLAATDIAFDLWQADGPVEGEHPTYRYPATIGVIALSPGDASTLKMELVDPTGQVWSATFTTIHPSSPLRVLHPSFVIGPRWPSGAYRLRFTLGQSAPVTTDPLLNVENWWPRHFAAPQIDTPLAANFANQVQLLGYKLPQNQVKAGQSFPLTLYWQALPERSPQADFIQFNHLLDSAGGLRGGYDRRPLEYYSTLLWAPGEVVVDGYSVPVAADAPPGQYYLDVGYYLQMGEAAVNLPLVVDGNMTQTTGVTLGPLEVTP